ncbi:tight junction-associated protein 1 [Engraulis encrasicolus]|uniref:tight junction-associated protein 1 n=1 Tax=Engraulis encrasicolus TaxID=184585 RepID=UPI002FD57DA0
MTSAGPARKPYRKAPPQHRETRHGMPVFREDLPVSPGLPPTGLVPQGPPPGPPPPQQSSGVGQSESCQESLSDSDKIKILQQQNEDLRRRLTQTTHKMEAMETEFEASRHYMQAEMGRTRDDLDKMRDKFRRLQNSYTASQRANQELEEKLHALLRKVERDKKTMDQEIVELTNKLLDAKNTIDKLEELNERYRQDCNLAVQLLKCNKSHFRNHKFADLPSELQEMVNKHMKSSLPERSSQTGSSGGGGTPPGGAGGPQDPDSLSLTPADVVPTSVIARVLEKPEPLVLNSAQSSSGAGRPVAEDVFVHVDMTGPADNGAAGGAGAGYENGGPGHAAGGRPLQAPGGGGGATDSQHLNGSCRRQGSLEGPTGGAGGGEEQQGTALFEKLNPYPAPAPPAHALYPGRKVIEFSSDDKVKIPKNSPLPNCTYATRQAISLSLVQSEEEAVAAAASERQQQRGSPGSPAVSEGGGGWRSGASSSSGGGGGGGSASSSHHQPRHRQAVTPPRHHHHHHGDPTSYGHHHHHTSATTPTAADREDPHSHSHSSSQSSPFSSPPQPPSAFASSGSSEEDLLSNWQRMFVEKMAPSSEGTLVNRTSFSSETARQLQQQQHQQQRPSSTSSSGGGHHHHRGHHHHSAQALSPNVPSRGASSRGAYSDGEEGSSTTRSWTASRESSLDTDTGSLADLRSRRGQYGGDFSQEEGERLLMSLDPLDPDDDVDVDDCDVVGDDVCDVAGDGASGDTAVTLDTAAAASAGCPQVTLEEYLDSVEVASVASSEAEERDDVLAPDFPVVIPPRVLAGLEDYDDDLSDLPPPPPPPPAPPSTTTSSSSSSSQSQQSITISTPGGLVVNPPPGPSRPQKSPKRMGVHHLHRKDSLTRAQEHGNLLD